MGEVRTKEDGVFKLVLVFEATYIWPIDPWFEVIREEDSPVPDWSRDELDEALTETPCEGIFG